MGGTRKPTLTRLSHQSFRADGATLSAKVFVPYFWRENQGGTTVPTEAMVALIGLAVALTTILSIRFGRQIARGLFIIGGLAAVTAIAYALAEQAWASRQAAKAASIAAAGESVAVTLLATLLILVVILAVAAVVYLLFRIKRAESGRGRKWLPGPNARWQQVEEAGGSASQATALNQLIMMEVLRTLQSLRQPQMQPPCLPTSRPSLPDQDVYALPAWDDSGDDDDLPDLLSGGKPTVNATTSSTTSALANSDC